jgi:hypothetical protein
MKLKEAELDIQNDAINNPLSYLSGPFQLLCTLRIFVDDAFGATESFDRWIALSNRIVPIQVGDLKKRRNALA